MPPRTQSVMIITKKAQAQGRDGAWPFGLDAAGHTFDRRWRKVAPVKRVLSIPNNDDDVWVLLGAHYRAFNPLRAVMAIYGIIPISLIERMRIDFHPLRSTLLWVAIVNVLFLFSVYDVVSNNLTLLYGAADAARPDYTAQADMDQSVFAIQGIIHVSSHVLLPIMWMEAPGISKRTNAWTTFLGKYGGFLRDLQAGKPLVITSWLVTIGCLFIFPAITLTLILYGQTYYTTRWQMLRQTPAHLYQIVLTTLLTATASFLCFTVRDMANVIRAALEKDMAAGALTPARIETFRMAWLGLRGLVQAASCTPATGIVLNGYLLMMITFTVYQFLASLHYGQHTLTVISALILVHSSGLLLCFCNAAHVTKDAVNGFVEPLRAYDWTEMPVDLRTKFQHFQHTVETSPAEVSYAGFFSIDRSSFLTIGASVITYVIVLIQFRKDEDKSGPSNSTSTAEDYTGF